jgi:hypothetical protein
VQGGSVTSEVNTRVGFGIHVQIRRTAVGSMSARTGYGNLSIDVREKASSSSATTLMPASPEAGILERGRSMAQVADSD